MKNLAKSAGSKPRSKAAVSPARRGSAPATSLQTQQSWHVEEAPRLRSNRPVKSTGGTRSVTESLDEITANAVSRAEPVMLSSPPSSVRVRKTSVPTKLPSRRAQPSPRAEGSPINPNHNLNSVPSSSSSAAAEKAGAPSVPLSLPLHRATALNDGPAADEGKNEESGFGIVESSRSYLVRLSLEDAVVALERLRFLMTSHTAAVTSSQSGKMQAAAEMAPPQQMHVDPFKLSKRPLEDIAEELCSQLRRLTTAYAVASEADRCLLGVDERRRLTAAGFADHPMAKGPQLSGLPARVSDTVEESRDLLGTFGPMVSTQHMMTTVGTTSEGANMLDTRLSVDTEDSWGAIDLHKPNPGPRIAYPQRDDSENGQDFGSTVYKYPNGTVVSYPISTFGELVSTESGQWTTFRSRIANTTDMERHVLVSDGTQTDDTLEPTKKERELQAYVKALESHLTEKQRLEAMRESRGAKKSGISETLSRLARSGDNKRL